MEGRSKKEMFRERGLWEQTLGKRGGEGGWRTDLIGSLSPSSGLPWYDGDGAD